MNFHFDLSNHSSHTLPLTKAMIQKCFDVLFAEIAFNSKQYVELSILFVDENEAKKLNQTYRNINKASNVLSFAGENAHQTQLNHLGDLVICPNIIEKEATLQNKALADHYCHMIIHGTLHLFAYDHIENDDAKVMESLEIKILKKLSINNPY